tara:strand:+ start:202 stop:501 length:300 start_codon:yes stop_codon:yes gene_type:complete
MSNNLKELSKKLDDYKLKNITKNKNKSKVSSTPLGLGLKISLDFVASVVVGVLIGLGFDMLFNSKPIFFLIFLIFGIAAGFMSMYRSILILEKNKIHKD